MVSFSTLHYIYSSTEEIETQEGDLLRVIELLVPSVCKRFDVI